MLIRLTYLIFMILLIIFYPAELQAQANPGVSDAELVFLPPYCAPKVKMVSNMRKLQRGVNSPELRAELQREVDSAKLWAKRMGNNFMHLHHFCYGLNDMNKVANTHDKLKRRALLRDAINQFTYVLDRWPPDFPLWQEANMGRMRAQMMLKY